MKYDGDYIVINGKELAKIKLTKDDFLHGRYTEEEYRQFVEASQDFFEKYQQGEDCTGYMIGDADLLYIWEVKAVTVGKHGGKYYISCDGRHRAYVARKYKLNILVCVGKF